MKFTFDGRYKIDLGEFTSSDGNTIKYYKNETYYKNIAFSEEINTNNIETELINNFMNASVWHKKSCVTYPNGKFSDVECLELKFNTSIDVNNVEACIKVFIRDQHPIFTATPYLDTTLNTYTQSMFTSNQNEKFRYHYDKHSTFDNISYCTIADWTVLCQSFGYSSVGLAVKNVPQPNTKCGNIELKYDISNEQVKKGHQVKKRILLNFHVNPVGSNSPVTTEDEIKGKMILFEKVCDAIKNSRVKDKSKIRNGMGYFWGNSKWFELKLLDENQRKSSQDNLGSSLGNSTNHTDASPSSGNRTDSNRFAVFADDDDEGSCTDNSKETQEKSNSNSPKRELSDNAKRPSKRVKKKKKKKKN